MEVIEKQQEQFSLGDSLTEVVVAAAELANVRLRNELKSFTDKVTDRMPKASFGALFLLLPLLVFAAYGLALNALTLGFAALFPTLNHDSVNLLSHAVIFVLAASIAYLAWRRIRAFLTSFA